MVTNIEDENDLRKFSDEIYKFLNWYSHESEVELSPENGGGDMWCVLRDAITASRLEKLGGEQYRYDFESALDYPCLLYTSRRLAKSWKKSKNADCYFSLRSTFCISSGTGAVNVNCSFVMG